MADRAARLEAAIMLAASRLRPYTETHPYVATIVDAMLAAVDDSREEEDP